MPWAEPGCPQTFQELGRGEGAAGAPGEESLRLPLDSGRGQIATMEIASQTSYTLAVIGALLLL